MLTVNQVSKRFGESLILESISCSINRGDRIGLIGPNGAGKSTLLAILAGDLPPDRGSVQLQPGVRVGHLRQGFADIPDGTLRNLLDIPTNGLLRAQEALEQASADFANPDLDPDHVADTFDQAQSQFEALGGYAALDRLTALLDRFQLGGIAWDRPLTQLSGGQKTRAGLAGLLTAQPELLILDEPTNHLDIAALDWLSEFLRHYDGAILIVSHDRGFLDNVVTGIFALDADDHTLEAFVGTYSDYLDHLRHQEEEQAAAWHRQQQYVARIEEDIRGAEHHARTIESNTIDFAVRKKAAKIARPAVVRKRKLERLLESEDYVDRPERKWGLAIDLPSVQAGARDVAVLEHIDVELGGREILRDVSLHLRFGEHLALIGPNGSGKTTLLRVITGEITPQSGTIRLGGGVKIGYFSQEQELLDPALTVLEQTRKVAAQSESDLRTFLHKFLFSGEMVKRQIGSLSYGERARLMLAIIILKGIDLLLLDEPLNHLDIASREQFERALGNYQGTMIAVLHDRYSIEHLATRVVELVDGRAVERDPALIGASA